MKGRLSEFFRIMAAKTPKNPYYTDSGVQTSLEDNVRKEKPIVTYSVAVIMAFLTAENENQWLKD